MKRYLWIILTLYCTTLYGQNVSSADAVAVATVFMNKINNNRNSLVAQVVPMYKDTTVCLYKIEFINGDWCLVPSTMKVSPILAFGSSDVENADVPEAYNNLVEQYLTEINATIQESYNGTSLISENWEMLLSPSRFNDFTYSIGDSLLSMTGRGRNIWRQQKNNGTVNQCSPSYNMFCPENNSKSCACGHYPVGCGAVAMGQILWYWQWPRASIYRTYHWEKMPASMYYYTPQEEAEEIAHLLRDCGRLTAMSYNCSGSFTVSDSIIKAFKDSLGYKGIVKHYARDWEYGNSWRDLISSEIDNGRPVLFYGDSFVFFVHGHFFVIDGYMDYGDERLFHVNWGHGGDENGFCKLDRLYEGSTNYSCNNRAIVGISPTYNESYITSVNYTNVPYGHKRKEYAYNSVAIPAFGSSLTVESGAEYTIEAGDEIVLQDGFEARYGSNVEIRVNPTWQSQMAISVPEWPSTANSNGYCINQRNADSWEFSLMNTHYAVVYQSAGTIYSEHVCLWDGHGVAAGTYLGIITLKNSYGRSLHQELSITVTNRDIGNEQGYGDSSTIENEMYFTSLNQETGVRIDTNMCVYPNPSEGLFELVIVGDSIMSIDVYNSKGQQVYTDDNVGSMTYLLNIENFPSDIYFINARCRHKAYCKKIIKQ